MPRLLLMAAIVAGIIVADFRYADGRHGVAVWVIIGLVLLPSLAGNLLQVKVKPWLDAWAAQQGLRLTGIELFIVRKGPFTWTSGDAQRVLRITARDGQGRIHRGWVCVGGWLLGLLTPRIRVVWDAGAIPAPAPAAATA